MPTHPSQNSKHETYVTISLKLTLTTKRRGTYLCLHCAQCSAVTKGETFTHPRSGKKYPIRDFFTCDSNYVVYLIKCLCGLAYVGETTQRVKYRMCRHKSMIHQKELLLLIPAHFDVHNHTVSQMHFQVIERIPLPVEVAITLPF